MRNLFSFTSILVLCVAFAISCTKKDKAKEADEKASATQEVKNLLMKVQKQGDGKMVLDGNVAVVHYVGTFLDGRKFDSSRDRGQPFKFQLGASKVIKGWDIGVKGMKVGEVRTLVVPPDMAYGEKGSGPIPPNTPLRFEIELLGVEGEPNKDAPPPPAIVNEEEQKAAEAKPAADAKKAEPAKKTK